MKKLEAYGEAVLEAQSAGKAHCTTSRKQQIEYRGKPYEYTEQGAFCDHCADGFSDHDAREEAAWLAFRDQTDADAGR